MPIRIAIDPNVRVRGNGTYAGFEDVEWTLPGWTLPGGLQVGGLQVGGLQVGDTVQVFEPESDLTGPGRVTEIDDEKRLVYLSVEWSKLQTLPVEPLPEGSVAQLFILQGGISGPPSGAKPAAFPTLPEFTATAHAPELSVSRR